MFLLVFGILLVGANAKLYSDCGSKMATVHSVGVSGCSEDGKECILKRNSNATITIQFTPSKDIDTLTTHVHGVIMNLPVPFPLPQPDACKDNGLTCPVKGGEVANYKATLPVLKSYPKVKVDVKWELKGDNDDEVVCVLIPSKIQ